jgi:hypothetical protein
VFDYAISEKVQVKMTHHFYLTNGVNISFSPGK